MASEELTNTHPSQLSFDIAWSPDCIDGRCYNASAISKFVDFFFVMAYDERSQIKPDCPCVAGANSGLQQTISGLERFLALGIEEHQLVLGLPWYGRDYPCQRYNSREQLCEIEQVPFRGVNCSDYPGVQKCYSTLMSLIADENATIQWDGPSASPFFTYQSYNNSEWHQVWYDNPKSLKQKYDLVKKYGLRGAGIFNSNCLDYSDDESAIRIRAQFWSQLGDL